jgi:hypothetical protein
MNKPRFGCFEIRTSCSACGNPLVLNGPSRNPKCDSCLQQVPIPAGLWSSWLECLEEEYPSLEETQGRNTTIMSGGFTAKLGFYRLRPRCPKCEETLTKSGRR